MPNYTETFKNKWLFESTMLTGPSAHNPYDDLVSAITSNVNSGHEPVTLQNGLKKLDTGTDIFYWVEKNNTTEIATQVEKVSTGLYIELTGKKPGGIIFASELYNMILNDAGRLLFSGNILSDEGINIWKRLFNNGRKIYVYDTKNYNDKFDINSEADFKKFIGDTPDYQKYRYALSENIKNHTAVVTSFDLMRTYNLTFNLT
jgi:hypothetical protein